MKKLSSAVLGIVAVSFLLLTVMCFNVQAEGFNGELKQLRYQYGKIRASFILHNNTDKDYKNIKVQITLLNNENRIISTTSTWLDNIPMGAYASTLNLFWQATTEYDLKQVKSYEYRILYSK